jgi:hypothetical protein
MSSDQKCRGTARAPFRENVSNFSCISGRPIGDGGPRRQQLSGPAETSVAYIRRIPTPPIHGCTREFIRIPGSLPAVQTYGVVYYYSGARERSLDIAIQKGRLFRLVSHEFSVSTGPPSDQYHNLSRSLGERHLRTALICLDARLTIVCIFFFFVPMVLPDSKRAAAQLQSNFLQQAKVSLQFFL